MKKHITKVISHPLVSGSAIIVIGGNIANVFNFFFNLFMSRTLKPGDYGELISLTAIITLFAFFSESFTPAVINFAAIYFANNELNKVKSLYKQVSKVTILLGGLIFAIFVIFSTVISSFLKINDPFIVVIAGVCVFFSFIGIVNKSLLQAKLAFTFISVSSIVGSISKLAFGVLFVLLGFRVYGAILGFILAFIFPYALSFYPLLPVFRIKKTFITIPVNRLVGYGLPSALAIVGLNSFINTDIIMVKHFFTPDQAGLYAGIGIVSKIVYYLSAPVGSVMFSLVVQKYARKENFHLDFLLAILLVLLPSIFVTFIYFIYPSFIIDTVLKKNEYLEGASFLGLFAVYIGLYTVLSVVVNFYLSIQLVRIYIPIIVFAIMQILLISVFHNSFEQIILISTAIISLLLFSLLIYYWRRIAVVKK